LRPVLLLRLRRLIWRAHSVREFRARAVVFGLLLMSLRALGEKAGILVPLSDAGFSPVAALPRLPPGGSCSASRAP
jgi:hypothetical protein